jgi:hypothetical protein
MDITPTVVDPGPDSDQCDASRGDFRWDQEDSPHLHLRTLWYSPLTVGAYLA